VYNVDLLGDDAFMADSVFSGGVSVSSRRRRRSAAERRLIVEETLVSGSSVARVALKHGVNANQVFKWRRLYEAGRLGTSPASALQLLPVRVSEERAVESDPFAAAVPGSCSIHIELPGEVRISLEGTVDASMVRAVLESLRS
jgi:transposase